MKNIANIIAGLMLATWAIAIAIFSVQNATPVSLKLLGFQSIQIPVGVVLTLSGAMGVVLGAIALPLFTRSDRQLEDGE